MKPKGARDWHDSGVYFFNQIPSNGEIAINFAREEEQNLRAFVETGGGLVALHGAADCHEANHDFLSMLGARFIDHDPEAPTWPVFFPNPDHPLVRSIFEFSITDEFSPVGGYGS